MGHPKAQAFYPPLHQALSPRRVTGFRRTTFRQWFTRTCSSQMAQPADHPAAGGLLHTPSHPCLPYGRRFFSSALTCRHRQLPFSEVEYPVLPGLSSRPKGPATDRNTAFKGAKLVLFSEKASFFKRFLHSFLLHKRKKRFNIEN